MEKRRPSYDLEAIKRAIGSADTLSITVKAFRDAASLGYNRRGIADIVRGIRRDMFFKSMTTYADHRVWQDVYHVPSSDLTLYIKFQADTVTQFSVVSFKEK